MENPVLHLKEVSVYQKNNLILSNVNLTVGKGELVYLIGKTGSGKSSLIKLLYGDLPLTKGQGKVVGRHDNPQGFDCMAKGDELCLGYL